MNTRTLTKTPALMMLAGLFISAALCGCQTNIGGQTLPSAHYLSDDVQYFPAGPEYLLPNTVKAHQDYRAAQAESGEYRN